MPRALSSALFRVRRQASLVPLLVSTPVARLRVWAPAVLLLVVLRGHLRAISKVLHSTVLPDRTVSIAADRRISVASRVALPP